MKIILASVITLLALHAIGSGGAAAEPANLRVTDAYVRGMPPGRTVTAAFLTLTNSGDSDCTLIGASSDIAARTELHTHRLEDGLMKMREVAQIAVPAGETVTLEPGGLHVMLYGTRQGLADGERVKMTLRFNDCAELVVTAEVRHPNRRK